MDEAGADYRVSKNTLIKLAAKGTDAEGISELLTGNNALGTTTGDPVPLAKALVDYAKGNDKFVVKGGVLGGRRLGFENIKALADLPGREVLLATMLGTMNAVPGGFVRVLAAVPQSLVYALAAIKEQKEGQAPKHLPDHSRIITTRQIFWGQRPDNLAQETACIRRNKKWQTSPKPMLLNSSKI